MKFCRAISARTMRRSLVVCPSVARQPYVGGNGSSAWAPRRWAGSSPSQQDLRDRNVKLAVYASAAVLGVVGLAYASVPLYQMFCQATGYGGTTQKATEEQFKNMVPVANARQIKVLFLAETSASMPWTFVPQQKFVKVVPGETALAFYTAHNPTDHAVTGVSTYNVSPARAGLYFHKIQCFCFEEQRLRAHEEIDMPVFFYIDPAFLDDPSLSNCRSITLAYTFFRTGEAEVLDPESDARKRAAADGASSSSAVKEWMTDIAARTGVPLKDRDARVDSDGQVRPAPRVSA